jgi:hypothetical protein
VEARARLIAENVELLIGDVENGLLDTLAETPAEQLDPFLDQWERSNPLVRAAFRCTADGRLIRPPPAAGDETTSGFRRRIALLIQSGPPWDPHLSLKSKLPSFAQANSVVVAPDLQQMDASNAFGAQNARRDLQPPAQESPRWNPRPASKANLPSAAAASMADADLLTRQQMVTSNSAVTQSARRDLQELARARSAAPSIVAKKVEAGSVMKDFEEQARPVLPDRHGWIPWPVEGRLHLIG